MTTQHELNKHDTIEHAKLDREMSWDLNTKQKKKTVSSWGKLGVGEVVFPRG